MVTLSIHLTPYFLPASRAISLFSVSVSLLRLCKEVYQYDISRFHVYVLVYDICFSLSDLTLYNRLCIIRSTNSIRTEEYIILICHLYFTKLTEVHTLFILIFFDGSCWASYSLFMLLVSSLLKWE